MTLMVSNPSDRVAAFHPEVQSERYDQYFAWFLNSTNQKAVAWHWLSALLSTIPRHDVCIDVGAGRGDMLKGLSAYFRRCIGIEPGREMAESLTQNYPTMELHPTNILGANVPPNLANLALMSHVKYYIALDQWAVNTDRVISWLVPGGTLVDVLQNPFSDFQKMIATFLGAESVCNLQAWAFEYAAKRRLPVSIDCREAWVEHDSLEKMLGVAIFMMNNALPGTLAEHPNRPRRGQLAEWIDTHYRTDNGRYRMSCHQDFAVYIKPMVHPEILSP
jgi:hypothetical protein